MWNEPSRLIAKCVAVFGVLGFLQAFWLGFIPSDLLARIELPNTLGSERVIAPNGRVFVASVPLGRVQRYGPDGFERGFHVDAQGGVFDIAVSPYGDVLICSVRARGLIIYSQDGIEKGQRAPCTYSGGNGGRVQGYPDFYMSNARVPQIALSWPALLTVSLWHPVVAWLMAVGAMAFLKFGPATSLDEKAK